MNGPRRPKRNSLVYGAVTTWSAIVALNITYEEQKGTLLAVLVDLDAGFQDLRVEDDANSSTVTVVVVFRGNTEQRFALRTVDATVALVTVSTRVEVNAVSKNDAQPTRRDAEETVGLGLVLAVEPSDLTAATSVSAGRTNVSKANSNERFSQRHDTRYVNAFLSVRMKRWLPSVWSRLDAASTKPFVPPANEQGFRLDAVIVLQVKDNDNIRYCLSGLEKPSQRYRWRHRHARGLPCGSLGSSHHHPSVLCTI